ncbi:MAG: hypothetical protein HYY85_05165 [Deltaproteobacteria bacterium]|nr:hypothetical protein [Deltaproteobacteria bacterium]
MDILATVVAPWQAFLTKLANFLPNIFAAGVIVIAGYFFAKLVQLATVKLLAWIHFEQAAEKSGIKEVLEKGAIRQSPSELIGLLIYWLLVLLVMVTALNALGLPVVSDLLNEILLYIPQVIAAVVVLILGLLFANFFATAVQTACSNAKIVQAENFGKVAKYAIVVFAVGMAMEQLGIATEMVLAAFVLLFGAVCLAAALAFGIGGREIAAEFLRKWFEEHKRGR